jgi:hypothetical protein
MEIMGYTKAQKKKLRQLVGIANERELDQEMDKLSAGSGIMLKTRKVVTFKCYVKLRDKINEAYSTTADVRL